MPSLALRSAAACAALCLFAAPARAQQAPPTPPRYLAQLQAELQAMGYAPESCVALSSQQGRCSVRVSTGGAAAGASNPGAPQRRYLLQAAYDDGTDTIYVYFDHYATLPAEVPDAPAAFRRMMELNWEMLVGRFEWSSRTGEVRLGAVLNTDSNFDRRAFRGVVRTLVRQADRYAEELSRLTHGPVGEGGTPAAPAASAGAAPAAPPAGAAPAGATAAPARPAAGH